MKGRLAALANRRGVLLEKIEAQRVDLAEIALDLQEPLVIADTGLKVVRFIRNHPGLVSGGFAALLSLRGKSIAGLVQKGWRLMYLYPTIISLGIKFLSPVSRSANKKNPAQIDD